MPKVIRFRTSFNCRLRFCRQVFRMALLLSLFSCTAYSGTSAMGGGNGLRSTKKELTEFVQTSLAEHLPDLISLRYFIQQSSDQDVQFPLAELPPKLKEMNLKINRWEHFVGAYVNPKESDDSPKIQIKDLIRIVDGPCYHGKLKADASTSMNKLNAKICLSASRLSRFPKSTFHRVIPPLIFHELAHQHGFNERFAIAFQKQADFHYKIKRIWTYSRGTMWNCSNGVNFEPPPNSTEVEDSDPNSVKNLQGSAEPRLLYKSTDPGSMDRSKRMSEYCLTPAITLGNIFSSYVEEDLHSDISKFQFTLSKREQSYLETIYNSLQSKRHKKATFAEDSVEIIQAVLSNHIDGSLEENLLNTGLTKDFARFLSAKAVMKFLNIEAASLYKKIEPK